MAQPLAADVDPVLHEALRDHRTKWARVSGQPPYRMFSNEVLTNLAALRPTSEAEFLAIKGLGPAKWGQFGREVLDLIQGRS